VAGDVEDAAAVGVDDVVELELVAVVDGDKEEVYVG